MSFLIGEIVHYTLTEDDISSILDRRRTLNRTVPEGTNYAAGQIFPALILRDRGDSANLQVFVDGPECVWVRGVSEGEGPGRFTALPVDTYAEDSLHLEACVNFHCQDRAHKR